MLGSHRRQPKKLIRAYINTCTYIPGNKLMQKKGQINVKRELNSNAKPWTQLNYNITFEINGKIIDVNIHWNYFYLYGIIHW